MAADVERECARVAGDLAAVEEMLAGLRQGHAAMEAQVSEEQLSAPSLGELASPVGGELSTPLGQLVAISPLARQLSPMPFSGDYRSPTPEEEAAHPVASALRGYVAQLHTDHNWLAQRCKDLRTELAATEEALELLEAESDAQARQAAGLEDEVAELRGCVAEERSEVATLQAELAAAHEAAEAAMQTRAELGAKVADARRDAAQLQAQLGDAIAALEASKKEVEVRAAALDALRRERDASAEELAAARTARDAAVAECEAVRSEGAALADTMLALRLELADAKSAAAAAAQESDVRCAAESDAAEAADAAQKRLQQHETGAHRKDAAHSTPPQDESTAEQLAAARALADAAHAEVASLTQRLQRIDAARAAAEAQANDLEGGAAVAQQDQDELHAQLVAVTAAEAETRASRDALVSEVAHLKSQLRDGSHAYAQLEQSHGNVLQAVQQQEAAMRTAGADIASLLAQLTAARRESGKRSPSPEPETSEPGQGAVRRQVGHQLWCGLRALRRQARALESDVQDIVQQRDEMEVEAQSLRKLVRSFIPLTYIRKQALVFDSCLRCPVLAIGPALKHDVACHGVTNHAVPLC